MSRKVLEMMHCQLAVTPSMPETSVVASLVAGTLALEPATAMPISSILAPRSAPKLALLVLGPAMLPLTTLEKAHLLHQSLVFLVNWIESNSARF